MRISLSAVLIAFLVGACSTPTGLPGQAPAAPVPAPTPTPMPEPALPTLVAAPAPVPPGALPDVLGSHTPPPDSMATLLTYSERLRQLSPNDLAVEIVLQGDPGPAPLKQMQLALALMQLPLAVDTARALGLLQRVANSALPDATPLKPLARLLAMRLLEQRRLEESLERQGQQLRENQRRIDQLNDRLEAMRAIERSLTTRPPAAPRSARPPTP